MIEHIRRETIGLLESSPAPLTRITDEELLYAVACPGFRTHFDTSSAKTIYTNPTCKQSVGAVRSERVDRINHRNGQQHLLTFNGDRNTRSAFVKADRGKDVVRVIGVRLRDRRDDGTPAATPPAYLRSIGGFDPSEIPLESYGVGDTDWYYSSDSDSPVREGRGAEISVVASDPTCMLGDILSGKEGKLYIAQAAEFSAFLSNPFDALPSDPADADALNTWWTHWYQVANRGHRGKSIPYPGQTSAQGFKGYFKHITAASEHLLRQNDYDYISAVPTWLHVWYKFGDEGYLPDDEAQYEETTDFIGRLDAIPNGSYTTLADMPPAHPLRSWYAVAPYAMALTDETPQLIGAAAAHQESFKKQLSAAYTALHTPEDTIAQYPLAPGRNLWMSKSLC